MLVCSYSGYILGQRVGKAEVEVLYDELVKVVFGPPAVANGNG